jgi:hypothetical protein
MFQFPRFPSATYGFSRGYAGMTPRTLPHSGIPGSTPADGSPRLFAAYHALHRLLAPRHPPCALPSAVPAPSRALPTPALAPFVLPNVFTRLCTCSGTRPAATEIHIPASPDPVAAPARRLGPPRRPTRPSRNHRTRERRTSLLAKGTRAPETQKPAVRARRPACRRGTAGLGTALHHYHAWLISLPTTAPHTGCPSSIPNRLWTRPPGRRLAPSGGAGEIRTPDLPRARRALSH